MASRLEVNFALLRDQSESGCLETLIGWTIQLTNQMSSQSTNQRSCGFHRRPRIFLQTMAAQAWCLNSLGGEREREGGGGGS